MWWVLPALAEEYDPDWPLTTRWSGPRGYFADGAPATLGWDEDGLDYEVTDQRAVLYVPDGEPPEAGWAVLVYVDADDEGNLAADWRVVLDAHRAVFVAPHRVGNGVDVPVRMALALDALASVEAGWPIDPARRVIGGFSGGAAVAAMMGAHWPDVFVGTVDTCRAVMWELHEISTAPGYSFGTGEIDHLDPDWLDPLVGGARFAFVSGDGDWLGEFSNYEGIMDGIGDWWARGIRSRVFDVPGMAHEPAPGGPLDAALGWVLDCADAGLYPPRFDSDHLPPATPFPTPLAAPPEACDAVPGPAPATPPAAEEAGCGCRQGGSPAGVVALALLLRRRRP